jgi:hypothetical protein
MAEAFGSGGDAVDFRALPSFGDEGHWMAERDGGEAVYGTVLDGVLQKTATKRGASR